MTATINDLIDVFKKSITPPLKIEWTRDLELGIPEIDCQHRQLVDLINELYSARYVMDNDAIRDVLCRVIALVKSHFALEERLMELSGFDQASAAVHRETHHNFVKSFSDYLRDYDVGRDVAYELQQALFRWLLHHNQEDVKYKDAIASYLKSQEK